MKNIIYIALVCLVPTFTSIPCSAAEKKPAPSAEANKPVPSRPLPFNGKVKAVDLKGKTVTVGERVFQVTEGTRLVKAGKPAKLEEVVIGEVVGGSYRTTPEGKLEAGMIRIGPKEEAGGEKLDVK
jgi:hypothetical protein